MWVRQSELDSVVEQLLPAGCGEIIMTQRGDISRLEELEVAGEPRLLNGLGVVPELLDQAGDERQLGHEWIPRTVALHLLVVSRLTPPNDATHDRPDRVVCAMT